VNLQVCTGPNTKRPEFKNSLLPGSVFSST
jgi:hypothetical protein